MKRETGVNPVQSRCCKLQKQLMVDNKKHSISFKRFEQYFATGSIEFGKAFKYGSKSEDLPRQQLIFRSFRGKSDELSANEIHFALVRSFSGAI